MILLALIVVRINTTNNKQTPSRTKWSHTKWDTLASSERDFILLSFSNIQVWCKRKSIKYVAIALRYYTIALNFLNKNSSKPPLSI